MLQIRLSKASIIQALQENNIPFSYDYLTGIWKLHTDGYLTYASVMEQMCMEAQLSEDGIERMYTAAFECEEEESYIHAVAWELWERQNPNHLDEIPF